MLLLLRHQRTSRVSIFSHLLTVPFLVLGTLPGAFIALAILGYVFDSLDPNMDRHSQFMFGMMLWVVYGIPLTFPGLIIALLMLPAVAIGYQWRLYVAAFIIGLLLPVLAVPFVALLPTQHIDLAMYITIWCVFITGGTLGLFYLAAWLRILPHPNNRTSTS